MIVLTELPPFKTIGPRPDPFFGPEPSFGDVACGLWLNAAAPLPDGRWECQWAPTGGGPKMQGVMEALKKSGHEIVE